MAFFTSLIDKLFNRSNANNKVKNDQYEKLEQLKRSHDWIEVKVTQTEHVYQSLVLDIDMDNRELVIDDLYPPDGVEKLQPGDTIEIASRARRAQVSFYTRILAREAIDGKSAFRVELPEAIGATHSRQAYRVYVNNEQHLSIDAHHDGVALADLRIINLSTEGIKLSFAEDLSAQLEKNRLLENCLIKLPTGFEVDCTIELRNIYQIRTPHPHTLAGGVMTVELPQQRVKLEQYLAAVQRKQRRRESRIT